MNKSYVCHYCFKKLSSEPKKWFDDTCITSFNGGDEEITYPNLCCEECYDHMIRIVNEEQSRFGCMQKEDL